MAAGKSAAGDLDAWLCFEDEAGQGTRPPTTRTWGRQGHTPVITVTGAGRGRVSVAALCCYKPGHQPRLLYRLHPYHRRTEEKASFDEADYIALVDAAHRRLGGAVVLVWDNLNRHTSADMRRRIGERDWLSVEQLPSYAPDLNPAAGVWSATRSGLTNLVPDDIDQLTALIHARLRPMQYHPELLKGCLAGTGLSLPRIKDQPTMQQPCPTDGMMVRELQNSSVSWR